MRRMKVLAVVAMAVLVALLAGCAGGGTPQPASQPKKAAAAFPVTVKDDLGRSVTVARQPQRIVSLAPANTEIVAALGLTSKLVGVTTYDNYPAEVTKLPKVGDFTTPNMEAIAAAKPDLVLVTGGVQQDVVKKLEDLGATVFAVDPKTVAGAEGAVDTVGRLTGTSDKAAAVVAQMRAAEDEVRSKVASATASRCFVEIAQNPLFTAGTGTLFDDMIRIANGTNVVAQPGFVGYSLEQLLKDDPQVYFATKGSMSDPAGLAKRPGYDKIAAVKAHRVVILDDDLVSRPGPRIVDGLREIAQGLHPEAFK